MDLEKIRETLQTILKVKGLTRKQQEALVDAMIALEHYEEDIENGNY